MFKKAVCLFIIAAMTMTVSAVPVDAASFNKAAVTGVKAVSKSYNSVKVSCKAKAGATGYRFYVAKSQNGKYSLAADATKNSAVIKSLKTDKTYYFRIRAYKGKKSKTFTAKSVTVKCAPKLGQPQNVSVKMAGMFNENVTWDAVAGAKKYKVFRSKSKNKNFKRVGTVTEPTFTGNKLKEKTVYYYKVRAFRDDYKSVFSTVIQFRSPPNGNADKYARESVEKVQDETLTGKSVYFLGSSITYGSATGGISFADFLAYKYDMYCYKETKSATTMAVCRNRPEPDSYVERLTGVDPAELGFEPDVFASQVSTNDILVKNDIQLGTVPDTCRESISQFDLAEVDTVAEAIEYITVYAKEQWPNCQVAFFTVKSAGNQKYGNMIELLYEAQDKWRDDQGFPPFEILDLWNDPTFINFTGDKLNLYMRDRNHPTLAGYRNCWLPRMANFLRLIMPVTTPDPEEPEPQPAPQAPQDPQNEPAIEPLDVPGDSVIEPLIVPEEEPSEQTGYEE